jgi:hypothetical protein
MPEPHEEALMQRLQVPCGTADHQPLYRQAQIYARQGIDLV